MRPSELVPGNCYFSIGFHDSNLIIPLVQTLVYVCVESEGQEGHRLWVFHDLSEAPMVTERSGDNCRPELFVVPDDQLHSILDLAGLIRNLKELAIEHPLTTPLLDPGPALEEELGGLENYINQFFLQSELESLAISLEFTNDGLSFSRFSDGSTNLLLSVRPLLDPDRETSLRKACDASGLIPTQDYLANRGCTRILVYPIRPDKWDEAAKLAARIFLEVYRMRHGDVLKYHFRPDTSSAIGLHLTDTK